MQFYPDRRRSPLGPDAILPEFTVDLRQLNDLKQRCKSAGLSVAGVRLLVLHALLHSESGPTAVTLQRTLDKMLGQHHTPGIASVQRALNSLATHGIVERIVKEDRIFHYTLPQDVEHAEDDEPVPLLTFVDANTDRETLCNEPELTSLLRLVASQCGYNLKEAAMTVATGAMAPCPRAGRCQQVS
ncbi:hypothetical protein NKW84_14625 [Acetobacter senegalensis]|uniref:hypothetical protein n=1 Tax=Acetobacter senegalensis TaxID=446692 RepID=UPI00209EDACA|nr:hypothetical protein [Acetobacter senegalensis]MCP1197086.1 hypothetical protein [Acetobacter senegalensis]